MLFKVRSMYMYISIRVDICCTSSLPLFKKSRFCPRGEGRPHCLLWIRPCACLNYLSNEYGHYLTGYHDLGLSLDHATSGQRYWSRWHLYDSTCLIVQHTNKRLDKLSDGACLPCIRRTSYLWLTWTSDKDTCSRFEHRGSIIYLRAKKIFPTFSSCWTENIW